MPTQTETHRQDKAPFPASALPPTRFSIVDCGLVAFAYVSIGLFYKHWKPAAGLTTRS